jgi:hypothetical protein
MTSRTIAAGCLLIACAAVHEATAQAADPFVGTWMLNLAKSSFPGAPPTRPYVLTFEQLADGSFVGIVFELDDNAGRTPVGRIAYRYDGMDYRDEDLVKRAPAGNTLAFTRLDARTLQVVHKLNQGKSVYRETRTVSDDGRTMTFVLTAADLQGAVSVVQVFDRQ